MLNEQVLNLGADAGSFVAKATDPVISPTYSTPRDFDGQYPMPLDPTEIIAMCEEVSLWNAFPELKTDLKQFTWRELNSLAFTSGSASISFADGACPEQYEHDGTDTTITLKNIGAMKSLGLSDIQHSAAVAGRGGINQLLGGMPASEGMPGGRNDATFAKQIVGDLKEKEVRLAMTLVMNGWDRLLATGNATNNSLEFNGLEYQVTAANGSHTNDGLSSATGSFTAATFDRFIAETCAKPTVLAGHPAAMQELLSGYFQLGYQGSQVINHSNGDRITPGFNYSGFVNTGVGKLAIVSDSNFSRTNVGGGNFTSSIYGLRAVHNGVPLIHRRTQIPLMYKDLVTGCTAISFEIWAKTALIVQHRCAHSKFQSLFNGLLTTTCTSIG